MIVVDEFLMYFYIIRKRMAFIHPLSCLHSRQSTPLY